MFELDPKLREYATDAQWEKLKALAEHGSQRKAADALGIHHSAVNRAHRIVLAKAAQHGYAPDHDLHHPAPEPFSMNGYSLLRDAETGKAKLIWEKAKLDDKKREKLFYEMVSALSEDLPRTEPVEGPQITSDDLLACYPIGDHHIGMLSWGEETGQDYDLAIAKRMLTSAIDHLTQIAPASGMALVPILGDFFHYDSHEPLTPTHGHQLDSDSRHNKMIRAGIFLARYVIECARLRHGRVHVIVEIGNHDIYTSAFLAECLAAIYENEPRVTIDTSPSHYHYFEFGKNLIGTHHGHGRKLPDLPLIMAADQPEAWGRTIYRTWWTGHVHHDQRKDYNGCTVESFRVLPPADAHAHQKGYRTPQDMKGIVLHREYGEVARHTVNPRMLGLQE